MKKVRKVLSAVELARLKDQTALVTGAVDLSIGTDESAQQVAETLAEIAETGNPLITVDPNMVPGHEVILVAMVIDDSGSMDPYKVDVVKGMNVVRDALAQSNKRDSIVYVVSYINMGLVVQPIKRADLGPFQEADYQPNNGTPLCDGMQTVLSAAQVQAAALLKGGKQTRIALVVMTDGGENGSEFASVTSVKTIMDALRNDNSSGLAGFSVLAFDIGGSCASTLLQMGVAQDEIKPISSGGQEIRAALELFSRSVTGGAAIDTRI